MIMTEITVEGLAAVNQVNPCRCLQQQEAESSSGRTGIAPGLSTDLVSQQQQEVQYGGQTSCSSELSI